MEAQVSIKKAKALLSEAEKRVRGAGHKSLAIAIDRIFVMILPDLIESHEVSPVHHPAHVVATMCEILLGERASDVEWRRGLVAALLHDVALGRVGKRKIRQSDITAASGSERESLIRVGIYARREHMDLGSQIAARALAGYNAWFDDVFSDNDIREIRRLIEIHDNPSVQEYESLRESPSTRVWLFDSDDRLMMFLREADRLWMLSSEGVEVDLERDLASARQKATLAGKDPALVKVDRKARIESNIRRHREEMELYRKVLGSKVDQYGFREGTLYRTDTGYDIFRRSVAELLG